MGKKHKHAPHENLERWVVSYADFMTLLFAVFTALFAMAKAELADQKDVVEGIRQGFVDQSLIAGIKSIMQGQSAPNDNPNPLSQERGEGEGLMGDYKMLLPQKGQVEEDEQNPVGEEGLDALYNKLVDELKEINEALKEGAQIAAGGGSGEGKASGSGDGKGKGPSEEAGKGKGKGAGEGAGGSLGEGKGAQGKPTLLEDGSGHGSSVGADSGKGSGAGKGHGQAHGSGSGGSGSGKGSEQASGQGSGASTGSGKGHGGSHGQGQGGGKGVTTQGAETDASKQGMNDVEVSADKRGVRIRFDSRILFHSGSAKLRPEAHKALQHIAKRLEKYKGKYLIQVEGHTDSEKIRSLVYPSNWELSTARASSVVRLFIREFKYPPAVMSAAGYGDSRPIGDNKTVEGRSKNRRIEFLLFTDPEEAKQHQGKKTPQEKKKAAQKKKPKPKPSRLQKQLLQKITVQDDNQPVKVILMQTDGQTGQVMSQKEWPVKVGGTSHQHASHRGSDSGTSDHLAPHAAERIPFDEGHGHDSHGGHH